jgi:hypothetical protein
MMNLIHMNVALTIKYFLTQNTENEDNSYHQPL